MAKSVVDGALTKAQAAIEEEAKLRQSAARNLVFITGEFQMMQSFLNVADGERLRNIVVRTWVRQIRDLAYDVEDCIDFVIHLDKRNRWWLRLLQPMRWVVPRCLPPLQLDEAVDELERLKTRVEDVSTRNSRYSLISDSGSKPAAAEQQPAAGDVVCATAFDRLIVAAGTRKASLTQLLTKRESGELRVISVWGSGGGDLGVTPIVWDAYIDEETCKSFACRAWVKLRRPFNPQEFVKSLTAQFFANTCQEQAGAIVALDVQKKMEAKQGDLLAEFAKLVNEKRFLVVLEDLSTMEEWNAITTFFPKGNKGSVIVVSTLHFEVASLSVGHPYRVLHLNQLSAQHSVYAFYKMVSQHHGDKGKKIEDPVARDSKIKEAANKWMQKHPLVGRESEIKDLEQRVAIASARSYQVMSVWGIAGVGKSALLKFVFCERIRNCKLYKKYAWVDISHPFNLWDFARSLLLSFDSEDIQNMWTAADKDTMGSKNPIVECRKILQRNDQKYLIVIDGLRSPKEWDLIQTELLSGCNPRTVIVVIVSEESFATHCRGPKGPFKYNVKGLEPEAAFHLFKEFSIFYTNFQRVVPTNVNLKYFEQQVSKKKLSPAEEKVLRELVSRCGGLPKVIVEIAGLLAKVTVKWMDRAHTINNKFMQELESNGEFGRLQGLFFWMQSYFRNCPDFLKPCIFYLSIFSPNQLIRRRRLVRRWIAEGYSRDSREESAEENGEKQFSDLLSLSIIQQPSSLGLGGTRMVSCQVNGFFREYIVSQRMEENLVFELDGRCALTTQRTGRHLVISKSWDRDRIVFNSIDFSRLRSLTVSGKWESFFISDSMKLLRVLDLEDALEVKYSDLEKIVKWFPRLKFLSLRGRTEICHLPSSVGDLRQLQTLDVRHTSIVTLPVNITKLHNLQYIRVGTTAPADYEPSALHRPLSRLSHYCRGRHLVGVEMPPGIGKLTALHTLGIVNISASGTKASLGDLKKLTQLRKLGVSGINKKNSAKFFAAISVLVHLESLSVRLDKDSEGCLEGIPLPLLSLRSLKLHGLADKLPAWSEQLTKLIKIDLEMANILKQTEEPATMKDVSSQGKTPKEIKTARQGVIMFLGMLPELCILRLRAKQFQDGELNLSVVTNGIEDTSYQKIKILEIACSSSSHVTFGSKTMKILEQLKVDCSSGSKYKFAGLESLLQLREVCLMKGSNDDTLKEDLEILLKEHERKPVVKKLE
ncbi:hypothetical protein BAE44_0015673 [Dichanthelium oligosanthes]|uniref:Disease resistance protein RPM1 n=1 Tax=Dichanthelium oligosanthes TaxID=888268 RepID=A0A1E5VE14_9POAL|nr:hypothetical protein BAE44_0015673 [Dichanthelium oligosanthes]